MTGTQFLSAVALGQVTPGPVVQTVAVVGYAAAGLAGGLFAAFVAFAPSFLFVLFGAPHFNAVRSSAWIQAFLVGAGACVIGAIAGSAIPLSRDLVHLWQFGVLGAGVLTLLLLAPGRRRGPRRRGRDRRHRRLGRGTALKHRRSCWGVRRRRWPGVVVTGTTLLTRAGSAVADFESALT